MLVALLCENLFSVLSSKDQVAGGFKPYWHKLLLHFLNLGTYFKAERNSKTVCIPQIIQTHFTPSVTAIYCPHFNCLWVPWKTVARELACHSGSVAMAFCFWASSYAFESQLWQPYFAGVMEYKNTNVPSFVWVHIKNPCCKNEFGASLIVSHNHLVALVLKPRFFFSFSFPRESDCEEFMKNV